MESQKPILTSFPSSSSSGLPHASLGYPYGIPQKAFEPQNDCMPPTTVSAPVGTESGRYHGELVVRPDLKQSMDKEEYDALVKQKIFHFEHPFSKRPRTYSAETIEAQRSRRKKSLHATGFYFLYGALMDPLLLASLLELEEIPQLRPAYIVCSHLEQWGSYAAMVLGPSGYVTEGAVYEVSTLDHAAKLQEYLTFAYGCWWDSFWCLDRDEQTQLNGYVFMYEDDARELTPKAFDLKAYLRESGRLQSLEEVEKIEAKKVKNAPRTAF